MRELHGRSRKRAIFRTKKKKKKKKKPFPPHTKSQSNIKIGFGFSFTLPSFNFPPITLFPPPVPCGFDVSCPRSCATFKAEAILPWSCLSGEALCNTKPVAPCNNVGCCVPGLGDCDQSANVCRCRDKNIIGPRCEADCSWCKFGACVPIGYNGTDPNDCPRRRASPPFSAAPPSVSASPVGTATTAAFPTVPPSKTATATAPVCVRTSASASRSGSRTARRLACPPVRLAPMAPFALATASASIPTSASAPTAGRRRTVRRRSAASRAAALAAASSRSSASARCRSAPVRPSGAARCATSSASTCPPSRRCQPPRRQHRCRRRRFPRARSCSRWAAVVCLQ
jgi:hypothetical protein